MPETRSPHRARVRRIGALALVALLALGGGTALALTSSQSANAAPGDVFFTTPEYTTVSHSPFQFDGEASPGDAITITSTYGSPCHAIADAVTGLWSCNMTFTASVDVTVVTVSRDIDDGNPGTQESDGQEHYISLPLIIDETSPGNVLSNAVPPAITGSGAFPGADIAGTIGAQPCTGVATGAGTWTCTSAPQGDGIYPSGVQQDVTGSGVGYSDVVNTLYTKDTSGPPWPESSVPYDSTLGGATTQTSVQSPTIGGGVGSAEPNTTVNVALQDNNGPITWPATAVFTPYCSDVADGTGTWSCTGAPLTVGHFYVVTMTGVDQAGNGTGGSPDADFGIEILPPPLAPDVYYPTPGAGEISPIVAFGASDPATTTSLRVREGGTDLCGVIIPNGAGDWSCPGVGVPVVGPHTLSFDAYDAYGTFSTTTVTVDSWGPPTILTPPNGSTTSASTVHVTGSAPIGSDLQVRLNGNPICNIIPVTTTYDCVTPLLLVPFGHSLAVDYTDPIGTSSATVVSGFATVPTLPAPVFVAPATGYSSTARTVDVSMTNAAEGTIYVREGLFDLCPPTPIAVTSYSCTTSQLSVGTHTITISQTDQYGVMSASAQRTVTILPTPFQPLTRKTFGFSIQVLGEDGTPVGDDGVGTGDLVTIVASNVPPGTLIAAEIHSDPIALGGMTVGQTGKLVMSAVVPAVPPGHHDIVVGATADGYWPGTATSAIQVRGLKQITDPADVVKELGEPDAVKELGEPLADSAAGGGADGPGGSNAHGFTDPTVFGSSVESPFDAPAHAFALSPAGIVLSGAIAIAFLLLVGLPAELLESTIRSNYDRAFGWLGRLRRRASRMLAPIARALASPWVGTGLTILAASIMLGFADPDFGFTGASVRLVLAMILAVVTINIGLSLVVMKVARRAFDVAAVLKPMPAALAIVGISVLVSRLAGISPGFLFGVVLGIAYARELKLRDEARLGVLGVGLTIGAGLVAWLGYGLATATISGQGFFNNLLIEALAAITLEALGTLVVALLPIEFLDGRTIFRWSKVAWAGLYALTALIFLFVVVPLSDNWGTMSAPIFGWGTLFAVFAAVAIITWAVFRRRSRVRPSSREPAEPRQRSRR